MASEEPKNPYVPTKIPEERPGPEGGTRHANRLARTRALCEAGLRSFLAAGLDAVTIDDVVQEAGTAKGTFYRYFEDKEDLVEAVFRPITALVTSAMSRCCEAVEAAADPVALDAAYGTLAAELTTLFFEQPDAVRLFLQERHGPRSAARLPILELDEAVIQQAVRMTEAGRTSGLLRRVDPRVSALIVVGAVHELLWQQFQGRGPEDPLQGARDLIEIVLRGVRAD